MRTLATRDLEAYQQDGFVLIKGLIDPGFIEELYLAIARLLTKYEPDSAEFLGRKAFWKTSEFHLKLMELRSNRPQLFGALYDSMQTSAVLQRLICNDALCTVAANLLEEERSGLSTTGYMVRMDVPGDQRNRLNWHQESSYYQQNLDSKNGLVVWIPLQELMPENGPIWVCPGSHKAGKIQVSSSGKGDYGTSEQYQVPEKDLKRFERFQVLGNPGDVLFFHMDLFHCSGENTSKSIRFTAGTRFHRMLTPDYVPGRLLYKYNEGIKEQVQASLTN